MTDWFVERLPELSGGQEDEQGRRWYEVHRETAALIAVLPQVPPSDYVRVERAGSRYAIGSGPFSTWAAFCDTALAGELSARDRSNFLWTLAKTAKSGGLHQRALEAAREKRTLDTERGELREAALAAGVIADILQSRGQLDEALRIRQEEELPVYEKLGDQFSLVSSRANLALIFLERKQDGDREAAHSLLLQALTKAREMRLPEAGQIQAILEENGLAES
jgi:hypothetical protein